MTRMKVRKTVFALALSIMLASLGTTGARAAEPPAPTSADAFDGAGLSKVLSVEEEIALEPVTGVPDVTQMKTYAFSFTAKGTSTVTSDEAPGIETQTITVEGDAEHSHSQRKGGVATGYVTFEQIFGTTPAARAFPHAGEYVYTVRESTAGFGPVTVETEQGEVIKTLTTGNEAYNVHVFVQNSKDGEGKDILVFSYITVWTAYYSETQEEWVDDKKIDPTIIEDELEDGGSEKYEVSHEFRFKNVYTEETEEETPEPVDVPLGVVKTMTGNALPEGTKYTFTFTVTGTSDTPEPETSAVSMTVSSRSRGSDLVKSFGNIHYTAAGTYTYTVTETLGGNYPGMTPEEKTRTVEIKIKENNKKLEIESITGAVREGGEYRVAFTNRYTPEPVEVPLGVKKILTGDKLPEGTKYTFTFTVTASTGTPMPAGNPVSLTVSSQSRGADLVESFGRIRYTSAGTYTYTVEESGNYAGMKAVDGKKTVKIKIRDNNGKLELESITGAVQEEGVYRVEITNRYAPNGTPKIGDDTPVRLLSLALLGSGMVLAVLAVTKIRRKRTGK